MATKTTDDRVPTALRERRRAESAAHNGKAAKAEPAKRQPKAKAAPKLRAIKGGKAEARQPNPRTLERVPATDFRMLLTSLDLTQKEVALAMGRSLSLVRGWCGFPGQIKGGRPTNPLLATARLPEVENRLREYAELRAKSGEVAAVAALAAPDKPKRPATAKKG